MMDTYEILSFHLQLMMKLILLDKSIDINLELGFEYTVQRLQGRINKIIKEAQQRRKARYNGFI